jgi:hypothetical protein
MTAGDLFDGIFDAPMLTGMQLIVLSLALLALFLYVAIWPKLLARECARDLEPMREQVRRVRAIHASTPIDPKQRAWAIWAISQIRRFTKRHQLHLEYLGISEAELTIIAFHFGNEQSSIAAATAPKAFIVDDGELCQRVDDTDTFDLEDVPPRPEPKLSVPPPVPESLRSVGPSDPLEDDLLSNAPAAGGTSKERRRARRAASRAAKERAAGGAKD